MERSEWGARTKYAGVFERCWQFEEPVPSAGLGQLEEAEQQELAQAASWKCVLCLRHHLSAEPQAQAACGLPLNSLVLFEFFVLSEFFVQRPILPISLWPFLTLLDTRPELVKRR